jgi:Xaa-Pro aminopeptidase
VDKQLTKEEMMRSDIDRLMAEKDLDGLLVVGDSSGAVMRYLTGGAPLEGAVVAKRQGSPFTLVHGSMERDTAAATGMVLVDRDQQLNLYELLSKHQGDWLEAHADFYRQVLNHLDMSGRIGLYGLVEAGEALAIFGRLQDGSSGIELVGEVGDSLFSVARETKDDRELAELQEAARLTCRIMGETREYIQAHRAQDEIVMRPDGQPLTIGDIKTFIRKCLHAHGLREDHENIFSLGRDAGVPHNRGTYEMPLRLGQTIIFDFFPKTASGYYHDVTRTWCLGHATEPVWEAWTQCKEIFDRVVTGLRVGQPCRNYQVQVCDYFESKGHPTLRSRPGTHEGYVHGLGHGIGLDIHEAPFFRHGKTDVAILQPGHVVTIEPGLYYPDQGYGVRLEDSVAFAEDGRLVYLTDYPHDLVVPMRG